jgi:hypothetical protein
MKKLAIIFFAFMLSGFSTQAFAKDQQALESRLGYLKDIPEVAWVNYNSNNVYIGFNKRPQDLASIVGGAGLFGNRAYGFGVHVWAVPADNKNWKIGDPFYCEATGRYGKVQDNDCR